jgi:hypothetical protein
LAFEGIKYGFVFDSLMISVVVVVDEVLHLLVEFSAGFSGSKVKKLSFFMLRQKRSFQALSVLKYLAFGVNHHRLSHKKLLFPYSNITQNTTQRIRRDCEAFKCLIINN